MDIFFVADDFTGGVDVLLQGARCGQPATMYLDEAAFLAAGSQQMQPLTGVATTFRKQEPAQVTEPLSRVLDHALNFDPRVVQYKICSTADSAPTKGSVGPAFRQFVGRGAATVPLLVGQPSLRRYTVFSHHFANDRGTVYRLDRQPTMAHHPSTPMRESDLRRHFAEQVGEEVGAITLEDVVSEDRAEVAWLREQGWGHRLVVLDVADAGHLAVHGRALARRERTFLIGSGGATLALGLGLGWRLADGQSLPTPAAAGPVLVVAGSCSQLTAAQIARVQGRAGWSVVGWDPLTSDVEEVAVQARRLLGEGRHVVVHSDGAGRNLDEAPRPGRDVSAGLAQVVTTAAGRYSRLVVAGGDTSGEVMTHLGAARLTTLSVLDDDTCLCEVTGMNGGTAEVVLKGGQIGSMDFFVKAAEGEGSGPDGGS